MNSQENSSQSVSKVNVNSADDKEKIIRDVGTKAKRLPLTDEEFLKISQSGFLITGGCGYIGSHMAQLLIACGAKKVYVIDDLRRENTRRRIHHLLKAPNFDFLEKDINDIDCIEEIMEAEEIDYVLHFASDINIASSIDDSSIIVSEIERFNKILNAANSWCKKFIYASSSQVYGYNLEEKALKETDKCEPITPFGAAKLSCEILAQTYSRLYGFPTLGLRFFEVYGLDQRYNIKPGEYEYDLPLVSNFSRKVLKNKPIELDLSRHDFVHLCFINDCAIMILKATLNDNCNTTILNIAGPEESMVTKGDLARIILKLSNSDNVQNTSVQNTSEIIETNDDFIESLTENYNDESDNNERNDNNDSDEEISINYNCADLTNLYEYINYKPVVPLVESLEQTINHYRRLFEYIKTIKTQIKEQLESENEQSTDSHPN